MLYQATLIVSQVKRSCKGKRDTYKDTRPAVLSYILDKNYSHLINGKSSPFGKGGLRGLLWTINY
jgi:hypothetical protein